MNETKLVAGQTFADIDISNVPFAKLDLNFIQNRQNNYPVRGAY